jgi:hypothetical protein
MRSVQRRSGACAAAWLLLVPAAGLLSACVAAAAAGAGAGGALYVTSRGAESVVDADVESVDRAVRETFADMSISLEGTKTEEEGEEREISGRKDDLDVTVHYTRQTGSTTKVEVTARKNVAEWDKDYAKEVLRKILREL